MPTPCGTVWTAGGEFAHTSPRGCAFNSQNQLEETMYTVTSEERNWAMFAHLSALIGYFLLPFGSIIAPLVIYLMKKDQSPFIAEHARESLNFQISLAIYAIVAGILVLVLVGFLLLAVIWVAGVILTIIAGVKASGGVSYRYPLTLRLIS
jgi:hypothetical protein